MRTDLPIGTVTFLVTDVEGSTRLLRDLGAEGYAQALIEHRRIIRDASTTHGGVEVDTQGDAFLVAFSDAMDAILAARQATERLAGGPILVRIGLHTGTPLLADEGYVGESLHLAARLAAAAHGGQVVLSDTTRAHVDGPLELVSLGEHRLKDIEGPVAVFQLGDAAFPPLRTISTTNLPWPASSFVGRGHELAETVTLLRGPGRVVTLTGPGGCGKTRLAIEAAHQLVPVRSAGVYWVDLSPLRDGSIVMDTIARSVGARESLADHIGGRDVLLVLDNVEQVIGAASELSRLVTACPRLTLLLTSRESLRIQGETEYPVPPLSSTDAVDLFCARSGLSPTAGIAELCRRLDDLPLAVELAAARATALSPARILERLAPNLDFLRGGPDRDPRQQTIRATIQWSHDLLAVDEQVLFRRLAVFTGGCRLEAVEAVASADIEILQSLVEKSLVRFSADRYRMLETIREQAEERLGASMEAEDVRSRHARWFLGLVERAEPELERGEQDHWLDVLTEEHDNIRSALTRADGDVQLELSGAMATFWWVHGHWTEGRRHLERALAWPGAQDPAHRAKALEGAAHLATRQLDNDRARVLAEESLELRRGLGDESGIARSLRVLGLVATGVGDEPGFLRLTQASAEHARVAGDDWALSMALNNLGYMALVADDLRSARDWFDKAIELATSRGDHRSESFFRENLGLARLEQGDPDDAHREFLASLRLARRLGFIEVAATDLIGLAAVASSAGQFAGGARLIGGAERLLEQTGGQWDVVEARVRSRTLTELDRGLDGDALTTAIEHGRRLDPETILGEGFVEETLRQSL